jgi:hypothetical protein
MNLEKMKKSELKQFYYNHPWMVPIVSVILLLASPIIVPSLWFTYDKQEVKIFFEECFRGLMGVDKKK